MCLLDELQVNNNLCCGLHSCHTEPTGGDRQIPDKLCPQSLTYHIGFQYVFENE